MWVSSMFSRRLLLLRSCERGWSPCLCKGGRSRKTRQRSPDHPKSSRRSRKSPLRPALSGKMSWLSGGSAAREPWSVVRESRLAGSCLLAGRVRLVVHRGGRRGYTLAGCALRNLRIVVIIQFGVVDAASSGVPGAPLRGTCKGVCPPFAYPHDQLQPTPHDTRGGEANRRNLARTSTRRLRGPSASSRSRTPAKPPRGWRCGATRSCLRRRSAQMMRGSLRHDLLFSVG